MIETRSAPIIDGVEYRPGRKFRVIRTPLKLTGMVAERRGGHGGWQHELAVGDVIECTGFGPGWGGDPGYGVGWTSDDAKKAGATHVDVWPHTFDPFRSRPAPGYLEAVED